MSRRNGNRSSDDDNGKPAIGGGSGDGWDDDSSREGEGGVWMSTNPTKRRGEYFFMAWAVVWVSFFGWIVLSRVFESFTPAHYMAVGVVVGLPPIIIPLLFPGLVGDAALPWRERYTTKANLWIFCYAWIGNYFWTHYFYRILGTTYTFEAWRLNDVPFALYLITHSYFMLYHTLSNLMLRRLWSAFGHRSSVTAWLVIGAFILVLSYFIALAEVFTIQNFPYYAYPDKQAMWTIGSGFYAIYFIISFPFFYRLDELPPTRNANGRSSGWSLSRTFIDVCAAGMIVTQLLDAWRLAVGPIFNVALAGANIVPAQVPFIN